MKNILFVLFIISIYGVASNYKYYDHPTTTEYFLTLEKTCMSLPASQTDIQINCLANLYDDIDRFVNYFLASLAISVIAGAYLCKESLMTKVANSNSV